VTLVGLGRGQLDAPLPGVQYYYIGDARSGMIWRRWNWLSDVWLPLLLATLRACWLWPCLEIAGAGCRLL